MGSRLAERSAALVAGALSDWVGWCAAFIADARQCRCSPGRGVFRCISLMASTIRSHTDPPSMSPRASMASVLAKPAAILSRIIDRLNSANTPPDRAYPEA